MAGPLPNVLPTELAELLKGPNPPRVIDVREPSEFTGPLGHVDGAELIPLGTLPQNVGKLTGETREIICVCKSGMRSQQAAGFLAAHGLKVHNMTGGMLAWNDAKLPIAK